MSEPFVAEIRIFALNFPPRGWAFCNGQLLPISQNTALFSLIGVTYGGDGRTTVGLPNLQGRVPMHPGNGPGLTSRRLGESGGNATASLSVAQMAPHSHAPGASGQAAISSDPSTNSPAPAVKYASYSPTEAVKMAPLAMGNAGGGQYHDNRQPMLGLYFCIALIGMYPSRA